jgi:hypothetical protein
LADLHGEGAQITVAEEIFEPVFFGGAVLAAEGISHPPHLVAGLALLLGLFIVVGGSEIGHDRPQHDLLRVGELFIPLPERSPAFGHGVTGVLAQQFVDVIDRLAAGDRSADQLAGLDRQPIASTRVTPATLTTL